MEYCWDRVELYIAKRGGQLEYASTGEKKEMGMSCEGI